VPVSSSRLHTSKLGHRRGRKIRQEASFDHGAASDILEISAMAFHLSPSVWGETRLGLGGERSGQVPFLLAEQRRGWSLMIFCARATRSGSSVWLAGLSGLSGSSE
jgi:hypothetical protein